MSAGRIVAVIAGLIVGAALGAASFWWAIHPRGENAQYGSWMTTTEIGQKRQSPYTRARVALFGIWGLPPAEVIYYSGVLDTDGKPLSERCTYQISGGAIPARWWSVTLYRDGFYIDNPADRYSWSQTEVETDPQGRWTITLAPSGEGKNRLTFGPKPGKFLASLRLYQPNPGVAEHRDFPGLPQIRKVSCS